MKKLVLIGLLGATTLLMGLAPKNDPIENQLMHRPVCVTMEWNCINFGEDTLCGLVIY